MFPEPNAWRKVLQTIDRELSSHQTIAVQEYGKPNPSLVAGLEARSDGPSESRSTTGICRWILDRWRQTSGELVDGQIDVVMFTSAHQVVNLLRMAERMDLAGPLSEALERAARGGIDRSNDERNAAECEIDVDIEPEHSKMGQLVVPAADRVQPWSVANGVSGCRPNLARLRRPETAR